MSGMLGLSCKCRELIHTKMLFKNEQIFFQTSIAHVIQIARAPTASVDSANFTTSTAAILEDCFS